MVISLKSPAQFLLDQQAAYAAATKQTSVVWQSGDILLSLFQSVTTQLNFLQAQNQVILLLTRASTSTGADLDSWLAQFTFPREGATYATGIETFGRYAASTSAVTIAAAVANADGSYTGGTLVQSQDGTIVYQVIPDTTEATYNATANAYILPAGTLTLTATVRAITSGTASNIAATFLSQQGTNIAGIDYVTNLSAISNGLNAELDAAYLLRFDAYLATLAKGTNAAILSAINSVQTGLTVVPVEFTNAAGIPVGGTFTEVVDDGSGAPSSALLASVVTAVNSVKAFGVSAQVIGPTLVNISVSLNVRALSGYTLATAEANAAAIVIAYVNGLGEGNGLPISTLIIEAASATGVASVQASSAYINGSSNDMSVTAVQRLILPASSITVGTY